MTLKNRVSDAIEHSLGRLGGQCHSIAGLDGWYHNMLDTEKLGHVATAQAILLGEEFPGKLKTAHTRPLLLHRFRREEGRGGWSYLSNVHDTILADATAWCGLALAKLDAEKDRGVIKAAVEHFLHLQKRPPGGGGWGAYCGDPGRIYHTCMALRFLATQIPVRSEPIRREIAWLLGQVYSEKKEVGWGALPGDRPTMAHTAHVLLLFDELPAALAREHKKLLERATDWLENTLAHCTGVPSGDLLEGVELPSTPQRRVDFRHSGYAVAVAALAARGRRPQARRGAQALLERFQQHQDRWISSLASGKETVWALHDGLVALKMVRTRILDTFSIRDYLPQSIRRPAIYAAPTCAAIGFLVVQTQYQLSAFWLATCTLASGAFFGIVVNWLSARFSP